MSDHDKDSKTEAPTGKRLHEAMERGQFPKAPEISVVMMLVGAMGVLSMVLSTASHEVGQMGAYIFSQVGALKLDMETAPDQILEVFLVAGKILVPILAVTCLTAMLAGGLQSGFNLTPDALGFKLEKLNPMSGLQRLYSKDTYTHGLVDLLKIVAISLILWGAAKSLWEDPLFSAPVDVGYLGIYMNRALMSFLGRIILALGIIAAISYFYEFKKSRRDMMMTREEVKEEHKQTEGDGRVKGVMRRMARRLLQKQMLEQVATADVVITNPTHYAVALRYERGVDQAPVILAKGENQFARRIKAMAAEHGVPTIENKPVARMLYALGRVDEAIPSELYQAVASILAMVYRTHRYYFYRLKARRAEARASKPDVRSQPAAGNPSANDHRA